MVPAAGELTGRYLGVVPPTSDISLESLGASHAPLVLGFLIPGRGFTLPLFPPIVQALLAYSETQSGDWAMPLT